jgi:hypothetical protein
MAFVHGKGNVVSIDGKAMTAYATSVTFTRTADSHDVTTFGNNSKVYRVGLKDGTGKLEGIYDNTASTGPQAVLRPMIGAAGVDLIYRPEGTGTGKPTSTVSVLVTSYEESNPVADMITWKADLQFSGDIADTTQ